MIWQTARFQIDLALPRVMGIVNITPDSFSDGAHPVDTLSAMRLCEQLLRDGADILDLGAESTRPGAAAVPLGEELARLLPLVRQAVTLNVPVSVDTSKPEVMQAVLDLGADIINDVWALRQGHAAHVVARHGSCGVCLMHMHGSPATMQAAPMAGDAPPQVQAFLADAAARLQAQGVAPSRIVLDPGIGFGKTRSQNFALLARQDQLVNLGFPLLVGWSRKSSLAEGATGAAGEPLLNPNQRLIPSVAAALMALERGAAIVRVHDVRETVQAMGVWRTVKMSELSPPLLS